MSFYNGMPHEFSHRIFCRCRIHLSVLHHRCRYLCRFHFCRLHHHLYSRRDLSIACQNKGGIVRCYSRLAGAIPFPITSAVAALATIAAIAMP